MNRLLGTAKDFQIFCDAQRWRSCIIGGLAIQRWGEPRVTRDVDISLLTGFGREEDYVQRLLDRYPARMANAGVFAQKSRVLLLQTPEGIGIDVSLAALPFEELVIERASAFEFAPGITLRTCSAEDLIVMKLFASRHIDLRDAEAIVIRNGKTLDWRYMESELAPLAEAKEAPEILESLSKLKRSVYR